MDRQSVFSLSVLAPQDNDDDSRKQVRRQLESFILEFRLDNAFVYRLMELCQFPMTMANHYDRDQLRENVLLKQFYCDVDINHLISFNEDLAHRLVTEPAEVIPLVSAIHDSPEPC